MNKIKEPLLVTKTLLMKIIHINLIELFFFIFLSFRDAIKLQVSGDQK